jgi:two-component system, NtrC family, sensor kinase
VTTPGQRFWLSLQAKVLIAVLSFLILLPAVTLWIVNDHMQRQMEDEARQTLVTAEAVFLKSLDNRSRNFLAHYGSVAEEARFKVTAGLADPKTMDVLLLSVLEDSPEDHRAILFFNAKGELFAGRRRASSIDLERFARVAATVARTALGGEPATAELGFDGDAYHVIAVPVSAPSRGPVIGALVVAIHINEATVKELKLPRTEILLAVNHQVAVSTVAGSELPQLLLQEVSAPAERTGPDRGQNVQRIIVTGEHFMARAGEIDGAGPAQAGVRYVMFSSYEQRLRALEEIRRTLVGLSAAGILVSAFVVSWFVQRITRPLRALRDSAEAVGRGDFSHRIEHFANDECGDLAETFNDMIANLQGSRLKLETAVETLKNTQSQLIQSEKLSAVGQFVAGVAHELNNPLTVLLGFSDLLNVTVKDAKIRPHLEMIVKSAHRCHKIVQSLLSFARQHPPERTLVGVNEIIDQVLEIMAYDLRTSNIKFTREFQADLPVIMADPHQLQQVFINILSNGRQAIQPFRPDGEIILRTRSTGSQVHIEFADNGPGIRPEHLSRIFDPFFTTKPVGKGTGLGMSLSYGIIHEHGGTITVRSEFGRGATFLIDLPVAVGASAIRGEKDPGLARVSRPPMPVGKAVLVVDDEEWILALTVALLREDGYDVETASDGEKAIECLGRRKFDVIVSDWKMPGVNGIQLYEHLRAKDPVAASRMLFMTGDVISDTFQEFLSRHAKFCLSKPFAIDDFRAAVANMLAAVSE